MGGSARKAGVWKACNVNTIFSDFSTRIEILDSTLSTFPIQQGKCRDKNHFKRAICSAPDIVLLPHIPFYDLHQCEK